MAEENLDDDLLKELEELRARVRHLEAREKELSQLEMESRLRDSERMLRLVLDTIPLAVFWKDLKFRYLGCNRRFAHDGGLKSPREIVGKHDFELSWSHNAPIFRADDMVVMKSGKPKVSYEEPLLQKGDGAAWIRTTKVPLRNESGQIIGVFGCYEDITELRNTLDTLAGTEKRYRALVEHATDSIVILEGEEGRCVAVNPAFCALLGISAGELTGSPLVERVSEEFREKARSWLAKVWSKVPTVAQLDLVANSGAIVGVEASGTRLPDGTMLGVLRDVTERQRAEEERRRIEEQLAGTQRLQALGRLASGVAHDFNNLLTVVMGSAEHLRLQGLRSENQHGDIDRIIDASTRGAQLTQQLLAFSRARPQQAVVLDVNEVVRHSRRLLDHILGEGIELVVNLCEEPGLILADPSQLEQVLLNLVVNARDAMPQGGEVEIDTWVQDHGSRRVCLSLRDSGLGMDEETREQIFQPFFTTKDKQGTGLGLSTVYGVVTAAGGTIEVESSPGEGTRFEISFPVARADQIRRKPTPVVGAVPPMSHGATILLAEDDSAVRATVQFMLESAGFRVITASDGAEALRLLEEHEDVDLLLSDVLLPERTGPAVAALGMRLNPGLRVVLMSGYLGDLLADASPELQDGLLEKPFTPEQLLDTVRKALGRT